MKLAMTLLVRDEEDIIRENIEFHLAQGVDFILATDNRSVDSTPEILREYKNRGVLHYIFEGDDDYNQRAWVTRMARMAYTEYGADWVINNDADEFWWPLEGSLSDVFTGLPDTVNLVQAERFNYVAVEDSVKPFWERMIYREKLSLTSFNTPLPSKFAHRPSEKVTVDQGNHSIEGIDKPERCRGMLEILHFPIRNYHQFENKIAKGGAAYKRNREVPESVGYTWRKLYEELQRDQNLNRYFGEHYYDEKRLEAHLNSGILLEDRRLAEYLGLIFRQNPVQKSA